MGGLRLTLGCIVLGLVLGACGRGGTEPPDLLDADAAVVIEEERGPSLRGRGATAAVPSTFRTDGTSGGPAVTVDDAARIHLPEGALWGEVVKALEVSAQRRRDREQLPGTHEPMLVPLPGLEGYVIVGGMPDRGGPTLELYLENRPQRTHVDGRGAAWTAQRGCDAETAWDTADWSLDLWRRSIETYRGLRGVGEHGVHVHADPDVPAREVIAFLTVVAGTDLGAPQILTHKSGMEMGYAGALPWLAAHQMPNGGWDDDLALALCSGEPMEDVRLRYDPKHVRSAGLTGACLCAFLAAGYTNRGTHPYRRAVSRGLRHLKNQQRGDGRFEGDTDWDPAIAHGFAALAMVEAYGMTGSPIFKGSAQRALDALGPTWRAERDDRLATALAAAVLKSAEIVNKDWAKRGKPEPLTLDEKLRVQLVETARTLDSDRDELALACALLTRVLNQTTRAEAIENHALGMRLVKAVEASGSETMPVVTWLAALGCFQVGREPWSRVKKHVDQRVVEAVVRDGHLCCLRGSVEGMHDPLVPGGRVAATAMASMCMSLYYKYTKVFGSR